MSELAYPGSIGGLTAAALLGTSRLAPEADLAAGLPGPLAALARDLADRSPEARLLLLAGSHDLYLAAGLLPAIAPPDDWPTPAFVAEGDLPPCPDAAAAILENMLNGQRAEFLPELLGLLAARRLRVPDELLPDLLDHGGRLSRLRGDILPVIGERGRWLASLNPKWRYGGAATVLDAAPDERLLGALWRAEAGARGWLYGFIRSRRRDLARRLLAAAWSGAADAERRDLLRQTLTVDLADEPFLERALDDRDSQVRRRAAELLSFLPGSRLAGRMTAAAGGILSLQGDRLVPRFPPAISDALVRDGVVRPTGAGTSPQERTRLLIFIVGAVPLSHWPRQLGLDPPAVVRAALVSQWPRTIIAALSIAASRQGDAEWARALVEVDGVSERTGAAIPLLPAEIRRALLDRAIDEGHDEQIVTLLRRWPADWEAERARRLVGYLARAAAAEPESRQGPLLRHQLRALGHQLPPSLAEFAHEQRRGLTPGGAWEVALRGLGNTLAARRELQAAVGEDEVRG